jgi:hypothetical protein
MQKATVDISVKSSSRQHNNNCQALTQCPSDKLVLANAPLIVTLLSSMDQEKDGSCPFSSPQQHKRGIDGFRTAPDKRSIEETKSPDSTRSHEVMPRKDTKPFVMTPAYFRSEKKQLEEHYEILESIGQGRFGEVKRIRDKSTNDIRALKILLKGNCQSEKEFTEELKILQRLVSAYKSNQI